MRNLLRTQENDLQVWPSYTDMALNVILMLLFYLFTHVIISSQTSAALLEARQRQDKLRQAVEQAIPAELRQSVVIKADGNLQRYTFSDQILFDSGSDKLKPTGTRVLGAFGKTLKEQVGAFSQIQIEGHTDDRKVHSGFPSNWELSSARATSVVRFLQDTVGLDPKLLSATGYSQYQPVDQADSDAGRAHNRRVEVVVVYSLLQPTAGASPAPGAAKGAPSAAEKKTQ